MRPCRQRVPVRRLTPTAPHASELLIPLAINLTNSCRCAVNGSGPGFRTRLRTDPSTTSNTSRCCDVRWNSPFPKSTSLAKYTVEDLDLAAAELNARPRKTLG